MIKRIALLLLALAAPIGAARASDLSSARDSLAARLELPITYQERVRVLRDLVDGAPSKREQFYYYGKLFRAARNEGDAFVQTEALCAFGNYDEKTDSIAWAIRMLDSLPRSPYQRETKVFLQVQLLRRSLAFMDEAQRVDTMRHLIQFFKSDDSSRQDVYDRILSLYTLCSLLEHYPDGSLYLNYLGKLQAMIGALPAEGGHVLSSAVYVACANFYTRQRMHREAVVAERKLMQVIRNLEARYRAQGRKRDYSLSIYVSCRRMLANYPALSAEEVEQLWAQMRTLAARNRSIQGDMEDPSGLAAVRYAMATHRYAEVLPRLRAYLADRGNVYNRTEYLRYFIEVSRALGDKQGLLDATTEYLEVLEQRDSLKVAEKYKELQILYDVDALEGEVSRLQVEKAESQLAANRKLSRLYLMFLVLSTSLLVLALLLLAHTRLLARRLRKARDQAQTADYMKSLFLQNMSHEIRTPLNAIVGFSQALLESGNEMDQAEREECGRQIAVNNELLLTLVGNVLDLTRIEQGATPLCYSECSLDALCRSSIDMVRSRAREGVEVRFEAGERDRTLCADAHRIQQVLVNLLTNACKFTREGRIVLAYRVDEAQRRVVFSVSDTGIGIPADKADLIFRRFEKLDPFSQGTGLGLHICNQIARAMGGSVELDTRYTGGARFLFTVPLS